MSEEVVEEEEFVPQTAASLYDDVEEPEKSDTEQEPAPEEKSEEAETDIKEEEVVSTSEKDRIAELEKQVSGMTGAYKAEKEKRQEAEKRPDIFEDQEGFVKSLKDDNAKEMNDFKFGVWKNDVNARHEDGQEVLKQFDALLDTKPWLWNQVDALAKSTGENPLQIAYNIYKQETKEDPEKVDVDAIEKAAIEKYKAELSDTEKKDKLKDVKDNLPTDLSKEPSRQGRGKPEYSSPTAKQVYD